MQLLLFIRKHWKKLLSIIGILIFLLIGTNWYLNQRWNRTLRIQLREYVTAMSDSLYTLKYANLQLNILTGSLTLDQVSLVPDTTVYARLQSGHRAPSLVYTISMDQLQLRHFRVWRYFLFKELNAGSLSFINPNVLLEEHRDNIDSSQHKSAYENISGKIRQIAIGDLQLDNTNLKYLLYQKGKHQVITQLQELRIRIRDLLIDAASLEDPTRYLYARNYEFNLKHYRYPSADSLYLIGVRDISYNAADQELTLGSCYVKPRYEQAAFDRLAVTQRDRFDVNLRHIVIHQLHPKKLLQDQQIWARSVHIGNGSIDIYRNRSLPMPPGNKLGQYPNQLLHKLDLPVMIDSLIGRKVTVQYTELSPVSQQLGKLELNEVNGTFTNITNIDSMVSKNNHCIARFDALAMKNGKLRATFDFLLADKSGRFAVDGQIKSMDGRTLNPVTKPLGMVEVKSCNIQDLTFKIRGDEHRASGEVKLIYDHLKIAILKTDEKTHEFKRKGLLSLFANALVIDDSNPLPGQAVRVTHPKFTRDIRKSFFNLVWKTLFTGVKETVGAGNI
ncbi:hypothetical protein KTO58_25810 [Chitinophaga pendula]|uniref:hypothetical protein n=1 Tax=Chitinophaga TaxID=79328 RepID=UPI0012FD7656|nr:MULTISPECIES: hypothetical protein [Chitinophaga]UCJ07043.1 hypothetical protein KTO58_25810 [Chitinophaga pendula]